MNLMIQIYMIVCVVLLVFDIGFLIVKNIRSHRFYPRDNRFENQIKKEIVLREETGSFSESFQKSLYKQLSKTKNMITLQDQLEANPAAVNMFRNVIFGLLDEYKKKSDYEQAYYTYIVSTLDYSEEKVPADFAGRFLTFLDSKSLYTFINTMNAIYQFGEVHLLVSAIDKTDERQGFYHKKLLVDGLLEAKVDRDAFAEKMLERFERYSTYTQNCLLDFFRLGGCEVSDFCLKLMLSDLVDKEVQYTAMRYFIKYPNDAAKEYFINILKNEEEWIRQMLAIQALGRYSEPEIRGLIKSKITSYNWHVRVNAADYLRKNGLDKEEICEIINLKDRYTNETLLYQYRDDEEMTAYISEMIELAGKENEKVPAVDETLAEGGVTA
ncbi:MAG: HEAT repeat domain-containing protein [Roseburia sp.]|nr:HEAT repeat domain-containing protein [Roseburia sp.]